MERATGGRGGRGGGGRRVAGGRAGPTAEGQEAERDRVEGSGREEGRLESGASGGNEERRARPNMEGRLTGNVAP